MMKRFFFGAYLALIALLFLYSYTQVDLSLTLSRLSLWQIIEKFFQNIGYFQRPLSAFLYVAIVVLMYGFYILFLLLVHKKKITKKEVWILIVVTTLILTFSYNAFSYDLFNYIFDAKILTFYHQNPYLHKALDYPSDPMLSFMRWTHRVYPYGPIWLMITVPFSLVGLNIFLPTFFLFKMLASISFLGVVYFIAKIAQKIFVKNEILSLVFFGLNPLVITESLVSSHNDIVMIFFSLWAIYLILINKYIRSFVLLALSIGVKFATVFLIPFFIAVFFLKKHKSSVNWEKMLFLAIATMAIAIIIASFRTNFQPWYLLYVLPFAAFLSSKFYISISLTTVSFFANLQYVPFLYLGNWDNPVPSILSNLLLFSLFLSLFLVLSWFFFSSNYLKRKMVK